MTVLVTGATGLLGNNIVRQLLARGESVRVLVRGEGTSRPVQDLGVEIRRGDIRDAAAVEAAMQNVSAVFHCAARVSLGWNGLELSRAVNVEGSKHVGLAARAAGARMIHISSIDALRGGTAAHPTTEETPYKPHVPCPYPVTKREAEVALLELAADGLDVVIINPGFMLGPWDWRPSSGQMLLEVGSGSAYVAPRGRNQFCGVLEVARGAIDARDLGRSGQRYIMTGELMSYLDAFRLFAEITGSRKPWFSVGPLAMYIGGKLADAKIRLTGRQSEVNSASMAMAQLPRYFSHAKATAELGYAPCPVRQSAELAWQWFVEHGYAKSHAANRK